MAEAVNPTFAARLNDAVAERVKPIGHDPIANCDKHGALFPGSAFIITFMREPGEEEAHVYCLKCVSEFFDALIARGDMPRVSFAQ